MKTNFDELPLDEQNKLLRDYQLGKSKIDPRTGKNQKESAEDYRKLDEANEKANAAKPETAKDIEKSEAEIFDPASVKDESDSK